MRNDLYKVLVTEEQLRKRVHELGEEITRAYGNVDEITAIAIINGSVIFAADLIRQINMPVRLDCMRVSSYRDDVKPVGVPEVIDKVLLELQNRHVLLIDDILDTGNTFSQVVRTLRRLNPASLKACVLLEKMGRREVPDAIPDFVGFQIPDEFVVGYGLDFAERYRNLPVIGILRPEAQNPPEWR